MRLPSRRLAASQSSSRISPRIAPSPGTSVRSPTRDAEVARVRGRSRPRAGRSMPRRTRRMGSSNRNCSGPPTSTMPFTGAPDGDPADRRGDVVGRHRLEEHRWHADGAAVGGVVGDALDELEELRRMDDRVRDRRRLDQRLLGELRPEVAGGRRSGSPLSDRLGADDRQRDVVADSCGRFGGAGGCGSTSRRTRAPSRTRSEGEFDTSTTTEAPSRAAASPSPVIVLMPRRGEAGTASCPCSVSLATSFEPMSPVPPMTTIFMVILLSDSLEGVRPPDQSGVGRADSAGKASNSSWTWSLRHRRPQNSRCGREPPSRLTARAFTGVVRTAPAPVTNTNPTAGGRQPDATRQRPAARVRVPSGNLRSLPAFTMRHGRPRRGQPHSAPGRPRSPMNSSKSALMRSLCVEYMPCGRPS